MPKKIELTAALAELLCAELAKGRSLNSVCMEFADGPTESTVRGWVLEDRNGFAAKYATARRLGYEVMADQLISIADEADIECKVDGESTRIDLSATGVARNRLRVDTRKWMLSKVLPKIYGDKLQLQGDAENPIEMNHTVTFVAPKDGLQVP